MISDDRYGLTSVAEHAHHCGTCHRVSAAPDVAMAEGADSEHAGCGKPAAAAIPGAFLNRHRIAHRHRTQVCGTNGIQHRRRSLSPR